MSIDNSPDFPPYLARSKIYNWNIRCSSVHALYVQHNTPTCVFACWKTLVEKFNVARTCIPAWSPAGESVRIFSIGFHEYKMFTNRIMIIKQDNDHWNDHVDDQWWWSMGWWRLVDLVATQRKHYNEYKNKYSLQYINDKQIKYKSFKGFKIQKF